MLAANANLQPWTGRTSAVDREAYEFADSIDIEIAAVSASPW